jgi:hypothetical protein
MIRNLFAIGNILSCILAIVSVLLAKIVSAQCGGDTLCSPVEENVLDKILYYWDRILVLAAFIIIPVTIFSWAYKRNIKRWVIVLILIMVFYLMEFVVKSLLGYN